MIKICSLGVSAYTVVHVFGRGLFHMECYILLEQLGGTVNRVPVQESRGPEFKSHLRHLTLTS